MDIRVILFDDNAERRDGIKLLLENSPGFICAGVFEDCSHLTEDIMRTEPHVILMDIDMPGMNGIEAVKIITAEFPAVPVMMQTVFDHDEKIFDSILAGATGYMLKKTPPGKLLDAIRELYEGGAPMTPEIAVKVLKFFRAREEQKLKNESLLTDKEKEILTALVDGMSYKMIAGKYAISYHTVNFHVRNIYKKLHVHSVSEAVSKALREKMI